MNEINGWSPPTIYDLSQGTTRIATQKDIDQLVMIERAFRVMCDTFTQGAQGMEELKREIETRWPASKD